MIRIPLKYLPSNRTNDHHASGSDVGDKIYLVWCTNSRREWLVVSCQFSSLPSYAVLASDTYPDMVPRRDALCTSAETASKCNGWTPYSGLPAMTSYRR